MVRRWHLAVILPGLLLALTAWALRQPIAQPDPPADEPPGPILFDNVTATTGLRFTHRNGEETANHVAILESVGGGAALLDYDGDGLLDVFLVGGGVYGGPDKRDVVGLPCKLYKNLGGFQFKDVTAEVGLDSFPWFYSHGCAVTDFDRDGWPDLLVTGWGRIALLRNQQGKFVDVTAKAGLDKGIAWATSAAFADLDGDGYPDLYVCQYVDWSMDRNPRCTYDQRTPDVCPPQRFAGLRHKLFHNTGQGTFRDVSTLLVAGGPNASKGLGVVIADVDGDGKPDVYVANDAVDNLLYLNQSTPGQPRFTEVGVAAGVATDERGRPQGSMGADAGDPARVGKPYLCVTNYENEQHALYANESKPGRASFKWHTGTAGLGALSEIYVGWGVAFVDVDLDGWEDLFFSTGHAIRHPKNPGVTRKQQPLLLRNDKGRFVKISKRLGEFGTQEHLGRGVAFGDLDNDGRMDMVLVPTNEPVAILRGIGGEGHHWLGVQLVGAEHADYVGARVVVETADGKQTRFAKGGGSYLSANDRRMVFGLGREQAVKGVEVTWPDGSKQTLANPAVDRYHVIRQPVPAGAATPPPRSPRETAFATPLPPSSGSAPTRTRRASPRPPGC